MQTLKVMAAVAVVASLAFPSVTYAAPAPPPNPSPGSNGDEFMDLQAGTLKLNPMSLKCIPTDEMYAGKHEIWFKNTGTETIPPTFWITVKYPDGTTDTWKITIPLNPGDAIGATVPVAHYTEPFKCSAKVSLTKP
jgi:hypothetical protein